MLRVGGGAHEAKQVLSVRTCVCVCYVGAHHGGGMHDDVKRGRAPTKTKLRPS